MNLSNNRLINIEKARQNKKKYIPSLLNENIWNNCNNFKLFHSLKNKYSDMLIKFNNISKKNAGNYKTFFKNFAKQIIKFEHKINKLKINKNITPSKLQNLKIHKDFIINSIKEYNLTFNLILPHTQINNKIIRQHYKKFYIDFKNNFISLHDTIKK